MTFVSRDLELNKIAIRQLNKDHGPLNHVYVFYHISNQNDTDSIKRWSNLSVTNKNKFVKFLNSFDIQYCEIGINADNVIEEYFKILVKQNSIGNNIFLDSTSLRKVTIPQITFLATIFSANLLLVVANSNSLYNPDEVFVQKGKKKISLNEWASKQTGQLSLIEIPKVGIPKISKPQKTIMKHMLERKFSSVSDLLSHIIIGDPTPEINDSILRYNLKALKQEGLVNYKETNNKLSDIELKQFGILLIKKILG